jgi:hypothetical protein
MFSQDPENYSNKNEALLRELMHRSKELEAVEEKLFQELNVTPEQISAFIEKSDNFTPDNWNQIQEQKKQLNEKLERDLKNIKNPLKTKKSYQNRIVDNRWLYVK